MRGRVGTIVRLRRPAYALVLALALSWACDAPVEAHLSVCAECRRLAEALRPAVELFQEAVDPEESRDLPGYWCAVTADSPQPAVSYAREVESTAAEPRLLPHTRVDQQWTALAAWRMAAMLAVGIALGTLAGSRLVQDRFDWPPVGNHATVAAPLPDVPRPRLLSKAELAVPTMLRTDSWVRTCSRHSRPAKNSRTPKLAS